MCRNLIFKYLVIINQISRNSEKSGIKGINKPDDHNGVPCKVAKMPNNERLDCSSSHFETDTQPRRSARLKDRVPISYDETAENYLICAQSLVCIVPKSYDEIKIRDDKSR